jgi:hypothetical protein
MPKEIIAALIGAGFGFLGGLCAAATNYFVSRREFSRSGARLLTDLQILEKARSLQIDRALIAALEVQVRKRVEYHTHIEALNQPSNSTVEADARNSGARASPER